MTTRAPTALQWLADQWESAIDTATFSGIVGDQAHRASGGYHISREDLIASGMSGDYSIAQFSDDRAGRSDLASGIDMTMDAADMRLVTGRLAAAWRNMDPRLDNVRGFNGTEDGRTARRWDAANSDPNATNSATDDHLWHIHMEIFRRYADDPQTMANILAVVTGGATATPTAQEDDMLPGAYDDYLPDTALAILTGETPRFGYPEATGPAWDNDALTNHNVKAVEGRLAAQIAAVAADARAGRIAVEALASVVNAGGGDVDTAAVIARMTALAAEDRAREDQLLARIAGLEQKLIERDQRLVAEVADAVVDEEASRLAG